jgi:hypothetical protein
MYKIKKISSFFLVCKRVKKIKAETRSMFISLLVDSNKHDG